MELTDFEAEPHTTVTDIQCYSLSIDICKAPALRWLVRRRNPISRALGWRVRQLRVAKGWTQERLAEHADLDRSYIAGIEAGLRNPSVQIVGKMAKALGVPLSTLFEGVR